MLHSLAIKQKSLICLNKFCFFCIVISFTFLGCAVSQKGRQSTFQNIANVLSTQEYDKARNFIISENFNDALSIYATLSKQNPTNATLSSEYAYALALAGLYEAAVMQLDRIHNIGHEAPDVNYFIMQTFALMGNTDFANEFWFPLQKYTPPSWIASKSPILLGKYKHKKTKNEKRSHEELIEVFKSANELASQNMYFQSIAKFQDVISEIPNNYLPYIGYGIVLEKTGAIYNALRITEKAMSLVGNDAADSEKKQLSEQRLLSLKATIATLPKTTDLPILAQKQEAKANNGQMTAYAGGMYGSQFSNLNFSIGYYIKNAGNFLLNFGTNRNGGENSIASRNVGLSAYATSKSTMVGVGILGVFSDNVSPDAQYTFSIGLSSRKKNASSSFDVFFDVRKGFAKTSPFTFNMSVGTSLYFGKRK